VVSDVVLLFKSLASAWGVFYAISHRHTFTFIAFTFTGKVFISTRIHKCGKRHMF
jgi:hypothetical protein